MTPAQLDNLHLALTNMVLMDDGEEPITMSQMQQAAAHDPTEYADQRAKVEKLARLVLAVLVEPDPTELDPATLTFDAWPSPSTYNFKVGMPKGVRVTHTNGCQVICDTERSQHANRDKALRAMRVLLRESRDGY